MSNNFHPYKKRILSNIQGRKKVIKKIKNHIDKGGSLESTMKQVNLYFRQMILIRKVLTVHPHLP